MGFSLKKTFKKIGNITKKISPALPGLGAALNPKGTAKLYGPLLNSVGNIPGVGGTFAKFGGSIADSVAGGNTPSTDVGTIASAGDIGNTGFLGSLASLFAMSGPKPPATDSEAAQRVAAGERGSRFQDILSGKNTIMLIGAVALVLVLVFFFRRK